MVPPLSCVVRTNYFDRLVVATVGPVAVSALIYFFYKLALRAPSASKLADWVKHQAFTAWLALTFFICALSHAPRNSPCTGSPSVATRPRCDVDDFQVHIAAETDALGAH